MPPLRTYVFKNKISSNVIITINVYGDETVAVKRLSDYVFDTNDWYL